VILTQDFARFEMHPEWDVPDWDTPAGAIEWPLFVSFLRKFKTTGMMPLDRRRLDYLTTQKDVQMRDEIERWYRDSFAQLELDIVKGEGERIIWGLVDGFLLYWDEDVINQLDVRIFLRAPHEVRKKRREERYGNVDVRSA